MELVVQGHSTEYKFKQCFRCRRRSSLSRSSLLLFVSFCCCGQKVIVDVRQRKAPSLLLAVQLDTGHVECMRRGVGWFATQTWRELCVEAQHAHGNAV